MTSLCIMSSFSLTVSAQTSPDLKIEIISALELGETENALALAETLYNTSKKAKNYTQAGYAAFAKAQIYDMKNMPLEAAQSYKQCGSEYGKAKSDAQSLQCQYQSGLAYISAGRTATARDVLKDAAEGLEQIGQGKSALAANSYLALSKTSLPGKIADNPSVNGKRKATIEYADKAIIALKTSGLDNTQKHLSALYLKAIALEDLQDFEAASAVYKKTLNLAGDISDTPDAFINKVETRYNITKSQIMSKKDRKHISVLDASGAKVELKIKEKRGVKIPRLNKNQIVDGASVGARLTLGENGSVTNIEILESIPHEDYGKAFEKAVITWKFIPPEGVSGLDIPPFNYGMTFSVKRR